MKKEGKNKKKLFPVHIDIEVRGADEAAERLTRAAKAAKELQDILSSLNNHKLQIITNIPTFEQTKADLEKEAKEAAKKELQGER